MTDTKTKAPVGKPARANRPSYLGDKPVPMHAADNMKADKEVALTFKIPAQLHKDYKRAALENDVTMKEIFTESFALWLQKKSQQ